MNRKGDGFVMSIKSLVGLLLGIALLLFVLGVGDKILAFVFPSDVELTRDYVDVLNNTIVGLDGEDSTIFYLDKGYRLVAFNKDANFGSGEDGYYERPTNCFNRACLVVCKDENDRDACLDSDLILTYDFDKIEATRKDYGIVSVTQGEYFSLYLKLEDNVLVIKEEEK